ncbi:hypothetical protein PENTCL1PPCAC_16204, partial [Pristionchus entomophagus]
YSLEEKFQACVDIIHAMPEEGPAPTTYVGRLAMYSLYKQVTLGPCNTRQPGFWNPEGRAKWDAWKRLGDMSREEAMELYVTCVHEAIDVGADNLDWDEYMRRYADLYEEYGFLREKFKIIDREYIKEDGSRVIRERNGPTDLEKLRAGPYSLEEKFQACVDIIHSMPKNAYLDDIKNMIMTMGDPGKLGPMPTSFAEMFTMYALYKQATLGKCNTSKPYFNPVERYKWDAWFRMGDMDKEQAMAGYVVGVLEKIDYCAEHMNWDEMLTQYADDYETLEPILREKFRIIDRELIKPDGSRVMPTPINDRIVGILSFNFERARKKALTMDIPKDRVLKLGTPNDPGSDGEYYEVREGNDSSRSSPSSLEDPKPERVKSLRKLIAKMDVELRAAKAVLDGLSKTTETRHQSIIKLLKRSARLSWRTIFFFIVWPLFFHWAARYFRGTTAIQST